MVDLIDRQAVQEMVDRIGDIHPYRQIGNRESYSQYNEAWTDAINRVDAELNSLPSADIDLSNFSDKLWAAAYERGKAEAVRWIPCGEMPDTDRNVFIARGNSDMMTVCVGHYDNDLKQWYEDRNWFAKCLYDGLYWCEMPSLPEPYKDGEQDG